MLLVHLPIGSAQERVVNVNTADRAQLESLPGLGPAKVELILTERNKALFATPADLSNRVKGLSMKSVEKLLSAGLIVAPTQPSQK
ncbi:ComEA family DNA-binding protein [Ampullimonas aquatilis]|uniref:ComEA family DNA-binding protein n=1 Tax=Ampullimonas aquatilis TaxID=1341549 RepID=UPI003C78747B